jgi:Uma2 family endonuclease
MAVDPKRYRFTRAEYHQMGQAGIFKDVYVELIDGDIIEMNPIGRPHRTCVDRLTDIFVPNVRPGAIVRIQGSIPLGDYGEPEPDLALLRRRADFYATGDEETPEDILLLIEVADSSERYDRRTKAPLYARFGIRELWIVDLNRNHITRYLDPSPDGYQKTRIYRRGESLSPLAFPDLLIPVDDILG